MTAPGQHRDLSPSARQSLRGLASSGRSSWRQRLDGTGVALGALLAGTVGAVAVRTLRRR